MSDFGPVLDSLREVEHDDATVAEAQQAFTAMEKARDAAVEAMCGAAEAQAIITAALRALS